MNFKHFIFALALFSQTFSFAQSFKFGTIAADVGIGGGVYSVSGYSPINKETHKTIAFVGTRPRVNLEFGLLRFFGIGFSYRKGTYGNSKGGDKIRGNDYLVCANFHVANKSKKFDLPIGIGYGLSNFSTTPDIGQTFSAKGTMINFHISPHFYFGNYIGMFISLSYNKHLYNSVYINDNGTVYTQADGATWNMAGTCFEFGISGKFNAINRDKKDKKD